MTFAFTFRNGQADGPEKFGVGALYAPRRGRFRRSWSPWPTCVHRCRGPSAWRGRSVPWRSSGQPSGNRSAGSTWRGSLPATCRTWWADDGVGRNRLLDRHGGFLRRFDGDGRRADAVEFVPDGRDQTGEFADRDGVITDIGRDDGGGERDRR